MATPVEDLLAQARKAAANQQAQQAAARDTAAQVAARKAAAAGSLTAEQAGQQATTPGQ